AVRRRFVEAEVAREAQVGTREGKLTRKVDGLVAFDIGLFTVLLLLLRRHLTLLFTRDDLHAFALRLVRRLLLLRLLALGREWLRPRKPLGRAERNPAEHESQRPSPHEAGRA